MSKDGENGNETSDKEFSVLAFNELPDVEGNEADGSEDGHDIKGSADTAAMQKDITAMKEQMRQRDMEAANTILASAYEGDDESLKEAKAIVAAAPNPLEMANSLTSLRGKEAAHFAVKAGATDPRATSTEGDDSLSEEERGIKAARTRLHKEFGNRRAMKAVF